MYRWILLIPFIFILAGIPFSNRFKPIFFGLPFSLFWIAIGILLASFIIFWLYKIDPNNKERESL